MKWYVLITRPHHELKLEKRLAARGFIVYCPKEKTVRQWSDRKKKVVIPLIPRVVFIRIDDRKRDAVYPESSIVKYLYEQGKPAIVQDQEIAILKRVEQGKSTGPQSSKKPGDTIDLSDLSLPVSSGIITKVSRNYVVVQLSELNMQIKLTL